jgi:branched-subunit amino acid transport protein
VSTAAIIAVVGAATYAMRVVFLVTLADRELPAPALRAMRNVGPAVLAALVASLLVGEDGLAGLAPSPELGSLVVAGLVTWRTRNLVLALVAGMAALWLLQWLT